MDPARKLKFSSYVHMPSIKQNVLISLRLSDSVRCRRGYYFRAWALYLGFGTSYFRMLILSSYFLPACINKIYKYGHAWVI